MTDLTVRVDFTILLDNDPNYIAIGDRSHWGVAENQPATIEITPPGSTQTISLNFAKHTLSFYNSVNLGMSCVTECDEQVLVPLEDGIWEIKLSSIYDTLDKTRYLLKTDSLRLELNKLYIRAGIDYNPNSSIIQALAEVEFLLLAAEAFVAKGDFNKAKKGFDEASKITEKYNSCHECV